MYADYQVLAWLGQRSKDFIIRCPSSGSFKAVDEFVQDPRVQDSVVTLHISSRQEQKGLNLPEYLTVRLVKVYLSTGETEVLITSLLDSQTYPREDFQWIYHQRWNEETYIGQLKHHWDVERVSSGHVTRIKQDFYASVFLTALASATSAESKGNLQTRNDPRHTKYAYKLNKAIVGSTLAANLVALLFNKQKDVHDIVTFIQDLFVKTPVPVRPGRSFERKEAPLRQQLRYQKYERTLWC